MLENLVVKKEEWMSENDMLITQFEALKVYKREIEVAYEKARQRLLERGSHTTKSYIVAIETIERRAVISLKELTDQGLMDEFQQRGFIKLTAYNTPKISRR